MNGVGLVFAMALAGVTAVWGYRLGLAMAEEREAERAIRRTTAYTVDSVRRRTGL